MEDNDQNTPKETQNTEQEKAENLDSVLGKFNKLKLEDRLHNLSRRSYDRRQNSIIRNRAKKSNNELSQQDQDAISKRRFRGWVLGSLIVVMAYQIGHLNFIIHKVVISSFETHRTFPFRDYQYVPTEILGHITEMLKWYVTATVVELIAAFVYIIHQVFAAPKSSKKKKRDIEIEEEEIDMTQDEDNTSE